EAGQRVHLKLCGEVGGRNLPDRRHREPPGEVNGSPEGRECAVKTPDSRLVRNIDITNDMHPGIGREREAVEFGGNQVRNVTNRVCGAQPPNHRPAEGTRSTGYDDVAACEIDHNVSSASVSGSSLDTGSSPACGKNREYRSARRW